MKSKIFAPKALAVLLILTISYFSKCTVNAGSTSSFEDIDETQVSGTIEVIFNLDEKIMEPYIGAFEKKYPGTSVKYTKVLDYDNRIKEAMKNENYGDVLFMPFFVGNNQLDKYFEPLGEVNKLSEKYNYVENTNRLGTTIYAIPSSAYTNGLIYNKKIFANAGITELPKNYEEFMEDLLMIKERTNAVPFCSNYASEWALFYWTAFPYIEMTGDADYKGGNFVHEKDPFLAGGNHYKVYKLLYDIVQNKLCENNIKGLGWDKVVTKLANGEIGCMVMGSWALNLFRDVAKNPIDIGFMPFPNSIDGKQYVSVYTDYGYAISKNSTNKVTAKAFLKFMLNESGYALDENRVSIVKTDPYSDAYGDMSDYIVQNIQPFQDTNYSYYETLTSDLNPDNTAEIKKIIDVAAGFLPGDYDSLMSEWNTRWEGKRPSDMKVYTRAEIEEQKQQNKDKDVNTEQKQTIFLNNDKVRLSTTEKEYIKDKESLRVGYLKQMAPFQYMSDTHNFLGIASQICDTIQETIGGELTYQAYDSLEDLIEALESDNIDIIAGVEKNNQYSDKLKYSKEYMDCMNVIVRNDSLDVEVLEGKKQAVINGDIPGQVIATEDYETYEDIPSALLAINRLECSFAITNYYSASYYTRRDELDHIVILPLAKKNSLSFAFSKEVDTRLISICNKCIYSIPEDKVQLMITQEMDPPSKPITVWRFVEANPILSLLLVMIFILVILGFLALIRYEKNKSRQKHELDSRRYEILARLMDEYIFEFDYLTEIITFDKKFESKFGFSGQIDALDTTITNYSLNSIIKKCFKVRDKNNTDVEPFELSDVDGNVQWYKMVVYIVDDSLNVTKRLIGKIVNVHEQMEQKLMMEEKVERDPLTGLYNRVGIEKHYNQIIEDWHNYNNVVFGVIDFDDFKNVNDTLGHAGGDMALRTLGKKLEELPEDNSLCGRYGGDEFIVCLYGMDREKMEMYLKEIVSSMDCSLEYQTATHKVSISLGAVYSEERKKIDEIFKKADDVLYNVKTLGKNNYKLEDCK